MTTVFTLPNGIRCVHEHRPGGQQVITRFAIHSGSAHEKLQENGLTFLTQEAINGGTKTLSRDDIVEIFENRATSLLTDSDDEETVFGMSCSKDDVDFLFPIMSDIILNPAYDPDEVEWTKAQIKDAIKKRKQNPAAVAGQLFRETVFAGQAGGLPIMGTEATLNSFTPDQLRAKHAELLSDTSDIIISIGGDIDLDTARDLITRNFGHLQPGLKRPQPVLEFKEGDARLAREQEHLNLTFAFEAPDRKNPERTRYLLLKELLAGGMSSPLFQEIREKRSLVYSVGASYSRWGNTGYFAVSAGTGKGNAKTLIEESLNLFGHYARTGFTDEQIEKAKSSLIRNHHATEESLSAVVGRNKSLLMVNGKISTPGEMEARLNDVTSDDLRHACADLMKRGRYALAGVGPQDAMPTPDEIKAMMTRQVQGLVLPPKRPARDPLTAVFQGAAQQAAYTSATPKMSILDNGMKIITVEKPGLVTTGIWVKVGAGHETDHLSGATHMIEHMMFKGTPTYPSGTIDTIVEQELGGSLNANTSQTRTAYFFYNLLPEHLDQAVSMLGEMVFDAHIGDAEYAGGNITDAAGHAETVKGERSVVLEEIKRANDNIWRRHNYAQEALCYPNQPMGRPVLGTADSLTNISAAELRAYRDQYYVPNNAVFVVAGPLKHEDVVASIKARLGDKKAAPVAAPSVPVFHAGVSYAEMESAQASTLEITMEAVDHKHKDAMAYDLLSTLLSSGQTSRLYREIVTKKNLATSMGAYASMATNSGTFSLHTQCEPQNIRELIKTSYETLARVAHEIKPEELDKVKTLTKSAITKRMETNYNQCMWYGEYVTTLDRIDTIEDNCTAIDAIAAQDLQRIALQLLNEAPALTSIIPPGTDPALIPDHKELVAIRDNARATLRVTPAAPQTSGPAPAP